jgi:hypothetical protein
MEGCTYTPAAPRKIISFSQLFGLKEKPKRGETRKLFIQRVVIISYTCIKNKT